MRLKKFSRAGAAVLLALTAFAGTCAASDFVPYRGYNYDSYNTSVPSAPGYAPARVFGRGSLGAAGLSEPLDLHVSGGRIFVLAESGVAILDEQFRLVKEITSFQRDGAAETLNRPSGIFAADGRILIADTENRRVLECDENGAVLRVLEKPEKGTDKANAGYLKNLDFRPVKVMYAGKDDIYVLVENCYLGILRYDADGSFHGFYGANAVEASLSQRLDRLWKRMMTREQRQYISNYVPVDYSSFALDAEGFVYTVTGKGASTFDEIRKLNTAGGNILRTDVQYDTLNRGDYGDRDKLMYRSKYLDSILTDIAVSPDAVVFAALDQQRNRVFVYDQDSNPLFIFGGSGEQAGLFRKPAALDYLGDQILVLDSEKRAITVFSPTDFGQKVLAATAFNAQGKYDLALEPWLETLRYDAGFEIAYRGIGKAYMLSEQYDKAMDYLRMGYDRENYSKAYKIVRSRKMNEQFYWWIFIASAAAAVLAFRKRIAAAALRGRTLPVLLPAEERPLYPMRHLIKGFDELRRSRGRAPYAAGGVLLILWFFSSLFLRQYTGFIFNMENPGKLNILLIFARTAGLFALWCVCASGASSMLSGEGGLKKIALLSAYSLTPLILSQLAYVALSQWAVLDEGALLKALLTAGTVWTAWLLFYAMKEVNQLSVKKTLLYVGMTAAGMLLTGLILVLLYGLIQQMLTFIMTIFNEVTIRTL